jgi:hypothetical protein
VKSPEFILSNGTPIRTHDVLDSEYGLLLSANCRAQRRPSANGVIRGVVPGHGGEVYCVEHNHRDEFYASYSYTEFEVIP